jgi:hypothetical protein
MSDPNQLEIRQLEASIIFWRRKASDYKAVIAEIRDLLEGVSVNKPAAVIMPNGTWIYAGIFIEKLKASLAKLEDTTDE